MEIITNLKKEAMNANIQQLELSKQEALSPYYEIQEDRMRRYFDCQDDTIFGGISDQVTSSTISKIKRKYDILIEQELNGGFLSRNEDSICLYKNDVMVSDKICSGKFGMFFALLDGTFISVAKKKTTFDKKGVEVRIQSTEYNCKFSRITDKGYVIYYDIEVASTTIRDFDFSKDNFSMNNNWIRFLKDKK
jgi:hypothetical protein